MYVAYNGHISTVQFLLKETNANINAIDVDGRSALMWAVIRGYDTIVGYLLEQGADQKLLDNLGYSALDWSKLMHRKSTTKAEGEQIEIYRALKILSSILRAHLTY